MLWFTSEKEVPMHQRMWHLDIIHKSYEESKFFLVEVLESFLPHRYISILEMYPEYISGCPPE